MKYFCINFYFKILPFSDSSLISFFLPQSYEEEELAAAWNSCARLSCLEHGFTIHSSFDLVPPYPRFEPRISLKCDSSVVINTGNLLHCLNFNLEKAKCKSNNKTGQNPAPAELMKFAQQWASATVNPHLFRYVREMSQITIQFLI